MGIPIGTGTGGYVYHPQNKNPRANLPPAPPPASPLAEHLAMVNAPARGGGIADAVAASTDPVPFQSPYSLVEWLVKHKKNYKDVDLKAVLANALGEGGWGANGQYGVGDQGTSFGPFQLHEGGALPAGRGQRWAESPAGLRYAMSRIQDVAGGLKGKNAVAAIVRDFERPADIPGQIALRQNYLDEAKAALQGAKLGPVQKTLPGAEELLYRKTLWDRQGGFYSDPELSQAHMDHVHFAANAPRTMLWALRAAKRLGLDRRENPYVDTVDPVHTENSWHYNTFDGTYGPQNKSLGEAVDVSGDPATLMQFYNLVAQRTGVSDNAAPFYRGSPGVSTGGVQGVGPGAVNTGAGAPVGAESALGGILQDTPLGARRRRAGLGSSDLIQALIERLGGGA